MDRSAAANFEKSEFSARHATATRYQRNAHPADAEGRFTGV